MSECINTGGHIWVSDGNGGIRCARCGAYGGSRG